MILLFKSASFNLFAERRWLSLDSLFRTLLPSSYIVSFLYGNSWILPAASLFFLYPFSFVTPDLCQGNRLKNKKRYGQEKGKEVK